MFWGLIIEPGKKYSQTVENSFHISKATLDLSAINDEDVTLMLDYEGQDEFILCHLNKTVKQESLDLNFQAGDSISLSSRGPCTIHLSGYLLGDDDEDDDMEFGDMEAEEEEEDEEEENETEDLRTTLAAKGLKRTQPTNGKSNAEKKAKVEMEVDSDSEEEEEAGEEEEEEKPVKKEASPPKSPPKEQQLTKGQKKKLAAQKKAAGGATPEQKKGATPEQKKGNAASEQKKGNASPGQQQPQKKKEGGAPMNGGADSKQPAAEEKKVLPGGLMVLDKKAGSGPAAKSGDQVTVYYSGFLKNGKKFDHSTKGPGFKFKLGAGRVIKGWDMGVVGMKVGGKRQLTIPAALGYGAGGSPPVIPPNSTLTFDIELRTLN